MSGSWAKECGVSLAEDDVCVVSRHDSRDKTEEDVARWIDEVLRRRRGPDHKI